MAEGAHAPYRCNEALDKSGYGCEPVLFELIQKECHTEDRAQGYSRTNKSVDKGSKSYIKISRALTVELQRRFNFVHNLQMFDATVRLNANTLPSLDRAFSTYR